MFMTLSKHRKFIALLAGVALAPILRAHVVPAAIHSVELGEPVVVAESWRRLGSVIGE
jgi:hypothetical protein